MRLVLVDNTSNSVTYCVRISCSAAELGPVTAKVSQSPDRWVMKLFSHHLTCALMYTPVPKARKLTDEHDTSSCVRFKVSCSEITPLLIHVNSDAIIVIKHAGGCELLEDCTVHVRDGYYAASAPALRAANPSHKKIHRKEHRNI